jgi:hypothetical protein
MAGSDHILIQTYTDPDPQVDCRRLRPADPFDNSCFNLIKSWMSECEEHVNCSKSAPVVLPKRVIEIPTDPSESPKLRITSGESGQYVILSHCWGSKGLAKLKDSLITRYQKAIDPEALPKSFEDAINITRRLGFRYLWIDALCIIQDNATDWSQEASKMAAYYGQSTLMITATAAENSSEGILTHRDVLYSPVMGKERKYCLRQRLLRWVWDIEQSVLATRGWTAQERMLAPRVIHYTKRQMIWECATGFRFEASGINDMELGAGQVKMHFQKKSLQPLVTKALSRAKERSDDQNGSITRVLDANISPLSLDRIHTWQQCVDEYSGRALTVSSDKLPALSGVAAIVNHDGEMGHYLAGIWSRHFIAGLAWSRPFFLLTSPPAYRAPSWSWASVDGAVSSLVLASPPELLQPPTDDIGKSWAERFDLKLIEHCMVLQDTHNAYGAVLEGSYIITEAACITTLELHRLSEEIYSNTLGCFLSPTIVLDMSNVVHCSCCGPPQVGKEPEDVNGQDAGHYDFCVFLMADAWRNAEGFVDMLLLCWVDQEAKVARRVGMLRMSLWQKEEDLGEFAKKFCAADWERSMLKLI